MTAPSGSNEVPLILDTDLGNDCDDAGALAVLHALADLGEARILAVGCQKQDEWGAPAVDAINTYYGRPDVPVGQRAGIIPGSAKKERLRYTEHIAKNFPNKLENGRHAPEVTALYRQVLAAQPDHSVVFCAIGPLSNLKSLLESAPDERSSERPGAPTGRRRNCRVGQLCNSVPAGLLDGFGGEFREVTSLSGRDLVARKVKMLVLQGGLFPSGMSWNLQQDPPAAQTVADDWPTPVVFSGKEIGDVIRTGYRLYTETPAGNPVRVAYDLYTGGRDRESWDQTVVLYAARGLRDYWTASAPGRCRVNADGSNDWQPSAHGHHACLIPKMPVPGLASAIEDLMVKGKACASERVCG